MKPNNNTINEIINANCIPKKMITAIIIEPNNTCKNWRFSSVFMLKLVV
jgi:hypothetical protein